MVPITIGQNSFIQVLGHRLHLVSWLFGGMVTRDKWKILKRRRNRNNVNTISMKPLWTSVQPKVIIPLNSQNSWVLCRMSLYLCLYVLISVCLSAYLSMAAQGSKSKCFKRQGVDDTCLLSPFSLEKDKISKKTFFLKPFNVPVCPATMPIYLVIFLELH